MWSVSSAGIVVSRSMELMGSYGYAREGKVEKLLRDFKIGQDRLRRTGTAPRRTVTVLFRYRNHIGRRRGGSEVNHSFLLKPLSLLNENATQHVASTGPELKVEREHPTIKIEEVGDPSPI
jgi:hypothetical protein